MFGVTNACGRQLLKMTVLLHCLTSRRCVQESTAAPRRNTAFAVSDAVLAQRTYFVPTMAAYVAGLGLAFAANAVTHLGQPALLYLVPCTLGAVAGTALLRGELDRVSSFTDVSPNPNPALAPVRTEEPPNSQP